MTVKLTNNFFAKTRGLTFEDTASVTWAFDQNTNELMATAGGAGGVTLGHGTPTTLISEGAIYFDLDSGDPLQGWVQVPGPNDPDFADVALLMPFDGSIVDVSSNALTFTSTGSPTTTTPFKFGTASLVIEDAVAYAQTPITSGGPLDFTGDMTAECWVNLSVNNPGGQGTLLWGGSDTYTTNPDYPSLSCSNTSGPSVTVTFSCYGTTLNPTVTANAWHHIAVTRLAGTFYMWVDGIDVGNISTGGALTLSPDWFVGSPRHNPSDPNAVIGFMDELRVTNGVARYTANFTPATTAFPTTSATDMWEMFGTDVTVTDGTTTATGVNNVTLSGLTLSGSGPNVTITASAGGSISVSDGTTTETGVTSVVFTGATVSSGGTGIADVTVSGGGSSVLNVTPDTHSAVPTGVGSGPNDEFEGSTLDTSGTRYSGATAWTWVNQSSSTTLLDQGAIEISLNGTSLTQGITEPAVSTPWTVYMKQRVVAASSGLIGLIVFNSSGASLVFGTWFSGPGNFGCVEISNSGSVVAAAFSTGGTQNTANWAYFKLNNDGTNLNWYMSSTGYAWDWTLLGSTTLAAFIGTVSEVGIGGYAGNALVQYVDFFRQR